MAALAPGVINSLLRVQAAKVRRSASSVAVCSEGEHIQDLGRASSLLARRQVYRLLMASVSRKLLVLHCEESQRRSARQERDPRLTIAVDPVRHRAGDAALSPQTRSLHRLDPSCTLLLAISLPISIFISERWRAALAALLSRLLHDRGGVERASGKGRIGDELEELVGLLPKDLSGAAKGMALAKCEAIS
jgi:hypothetical protein